MWRSGAFLNVVRSPSIHLIPVQLSGEQGVEERLAVGVGLQAPEWAPLCTHEHAKVEGLFSAPGSERCRCSDPAAENIASFPGVTREHVAPPQAAAFLLLVHPFGKSPCFGREMPLHKVITLKPDAVTIETSEMLPWEAEPGVMREGRWEGK